MKQRIEVKSGAGPLGPYSPAVRAGGLLFVSGQIPLDPGTGQVVAGSIQDQVRQTLENVKTLLEAAGSSLENAVKCTVFLTDLQDFEVMNTIYAEYFGGEVPPARTTVQAGRLPKGVAVEIDVIALA